MIDEYGDIHIFLLARSRRPLKLTRCFFVLLLVGLACVCLCVLLPPAFHTVSGLFNRTTRKTENPVKCHVYEVYFLKSWWVRQDSNPRQPGCKPGTLTN